MQSKSLKRRAIETTFWTVGDIGASSAMRLASNLILARLLAPELFGIIAIAFTIQAGVSMFSDIGLSQNTIQSDDGDDPAFLDTLWSVQILRGILIAAGLWCICALFTFSSLPQVFPETSAYRAAELPGLIILISFISILDGFTPTKALTAARHLQIKRLTVIKLISQFSGSLTTICLVLISPTVWAFAIGALFASSIKFILIYRVIFGRNNSFLFEKKYIDEILSFGKWIFLSSIFGFFASQGDRLIGAGITSAETIGLYVIAYQITNIFIMVFRQIIKRSIYPLLSRKKEIDIKNIEIYRLRLYFLILSILSIIILNASIEYFFSFLYKERFFSASIYVKILSLQLISMNYYILNNKVLSEGRSKLYSMSIMVRSFIQVFSIYYCVQYFGDSGIAYSVLISALSSQLFLVLNLIKNRELDMRLEIPIFLVCLSCYVVFWLYA